MASAPPPGGCKRKLTEGDIEQNSKKSRSTALLPTNAHGPPASPSYPGPSQMDPTTNLDPPITTQNRPDCTSHDSNQLYLGPSASVKPGIAYELKRVAVSGLDSALTALKIGARACPPLQVVIDDFHACLDVVKLSTKNNDEYEELTSELISTANSLNEYLGRLSLGDHNGSAVRIMDAITMEVAHIKQRQNHTKGKRLAQSKCDQEDVVKRYRRIESLFRQLQNDMSFRTLENSNKHYAMTLLERLSPVYDALYDSSYSTVIKRRGCTEQTREQVREEIYDWIRDPNSTKIYWMNGMAGTGKTTIAYSLCEWLEETGRYGGSFFCSRASVSCRDVNSIIPTIAYQLAQYSPVFQAQLCKILEKDPAGSKRNVAKQFEKLVQGPIANANGAIPEGIVVVIDALDECEDDYCVRLILGALLKLGAGLPVKFFLSSRPEPSIRDSMLSFGTRRSGILHLHDIEESIVEEDIKKYLEESFDVMSPLPSKKQIEHLAKLAGKLFIYAATVVRHVLSSRSSGNSATRLDEVCTTKLELGGRSQLHRKYEQLDDLYKLIVTTTFGMGDTEKSEIEAVRVVLWTIVCAKEPITIATLALLLSTTEQRVSSGLQPVLSVIHVSESNGLVSTLHASFADYMLDPTRSGDLCCNEIAHSELLAGRCFDVMNNQLRFNICNLESSFVFDEDVLDLEERIRSNISPALFYACRYWGYHLRISRVTETLRQALANFLANRLLFWVEVLNLGKHIVEGRLILTQAEMWLRSAANNEYGDTVTEVVDACDFVARFAASPCVRATPHLYLSALPLCMMSSSVYKCYHRRIKGALEMHMGGTAITNRRYMAQATWKTDSAVHAIDISSDGVCLAFGSQDGAVRVWDARTGEVIAGPFKGHTDSVNSVAFSHDCIRVASGSTDTSIRVWDARTGRDIAGPFQGHTRSVNSVAFDLEGAHVVSGSEDMSILVWDSRTAEIVAGPLIGHIGWVKSVAFSPDGARIASGSEDKTVRVWNLHTRKVVAVSASGSPNGHEGAVESVAFSVDGARVVSGSADSSIRVWDASTGKPVVGPMTRHSTPVKSVAVSPDGKRIVSGSWDKTIQVWDATSGDPVGGLFRGHTGSISSVAFFPDGTRIASGSADMSIQLWDTRVGASKWEHGSSNVRTPPITYIAFSPGDTHIISGPRRKPIQVWDARTGEVVVGPNKHARTLIGSVNSAAFSPDGTRVVSGSTDKTVLVWDARAVKVIASPFKGHTDSVESVAFSPDGTRVVSGSADKTIRVWDAGTGEVLAGPLEGHTDSVESVAFSSDGKLIVSSAADRIIRVWDVMQQFPSWGEDYASCIAGSAWKCHISDDGWVKFGDLPLIWLPADLRTYAPLPHTKLVISDRGALSIDYSRMLLGERWPKCYTVPDREAEFSLRQQSPGWLQNAPGSTASGSRVPFSEAPRGRVEKYGSSLVAPEASSLEDFVDVPRVQSTQVLPLTHMDE